MSSLKRPVLLESDAVDVLFGAVVSIAENSFFSIADRCSADHFTKLTADTRRWWIAAVEFNEDTDAGIVSCIVADDLAVELFDAFSGREPGLAPPEPAMLADLIGEFGNMVCGTWLTRLANHQTFSLTSPAVQSLCALPLQPNGAARLLVAINDRPVVIDVKSDAKPLVSA